MPGSRASILSHHDPDAGPAFELRGESGPVVGVATHAGHVVRPELVPYLALDDRERRYEEDPFSDRWARAAGDVALVAHRSRFECDVDRPRPASVYGGGEDAWGLEVWSSQPEERVLGRSRAVHDAFYAALERVLIDTIVRFGTFALLDFHAYNHRRAGPDGAPADAATHPDVNIGTAGVLDGPWAPAAARFVDALADHEVDGQPLDVRSDVWSKGGHVVEWVNERFSGSGVALAVAVKKIYMDEHSGALRPEVAAGLEDALTAAAGELVDHLVPAWTKGDSVATTDR